jgi:beta-lysine 5,6-aminomutase beta subunit
VARAGSERADAILVSQVVTQKDAHLHNTRQLATAIRAADWPAPGRPLLVVGGPRFDPTMTGDLGVDRIFGKGTTPAEVASYLAHWLRTGGRADSTR